MMLSAPSTRQCLELLGAKFSSSKGERRTEILEEVSETSDITPAILDALASICVAKKDDVVAVSAEILNDKIILRVAGNRAVYDKVEQHLLDVWRLLQEFKVAPRKDNPQVTPPLDKAETGSEMDLCKLLYRFSINKVCKRGKKYGGQTLEAFRKWDKEDSRRWEEFDETLESLDIVNGLLRKNPDTLDAHIWLLCDLLEDIYERTRSSFKNIDPASLAEYPWRGLRKILSLHTDAKLFARIPRSPVRHKYLSRDLKVIRLKQEQLSIPLEMPASAEELYDHFFPTTADSPENSTDVIEALTKWRREGFTSAEIDTIVHAECIMLLELCKQPTFTTGVYIGVSKLSCLACYNFFKAFSTATLKEGRRFWTKGCHGKFHSKWGDPCSLPWTEADERRKHEVQGRFGKMMEEALKLALTVEGHSRMNSDSTTATERSDEGVRQDREVLVKRREYGRELLRRS